MKDDKPIYKLQEEEVKPAPKKLGFDLNTTRVLTIGDVKKMKKEEEEPEFSKKDFSESAENSEQKETDEDMGGIVFGK